jgi:hypothetical protein
VEGFDSTPTELDFAATKVIDFIFKGLHLVSTGLHLAWLSKGGRSKRPSEVEREEERGWAAVPGAAQTSEAGQVWREEGDGRRGGRSLIERKMNCFLRN